MKLGWRSQFARPTGLLGHVAGWALAIKNEERSFWVLSLVDVQPGDRVLEVGCGPGVDVQRVASSAAFVAGIDHSSVMVAQSRKRNRELIRAGKVEIRQAAADHLPFADKSFDKLFSINVAQFWADASVVLRECMRVLRPGGLTAMAVQPRWKGADEAAARVTGEWMESKLSDAGFVDLRMEMRQMKPTPVVCVLARKPE